MIRLSAAILALAIGAWAFVARQPSLDDLARRALARVEGEIDAPGLRQPVQVSRDTWGIPHIVAASPEDLFFAQGYVAAQDRLWQMEIWRRTVEGRLAEIVGPSAVPRDRLARLLKHRGPIDDRELRVYHPDARALMTAFVAGVNTFISQQKDRLPVEFMLTGIVPEPWTIETLTRRQITFGQAGDELQLARNVAALGVAEANRRSDPDPWDALTVPAGLDVAAIGREVLAATRAGGRAQPPPAILPAFRSLTGPPEPAPATREALSPGSNNWVVSGARSATGKPVVVNDPHREVTLPSLRYLTHLQAPGWNVIGATEPPFLSIAVGHNEHLAWGLTIVGTDQHDVYVEELHPSNPDQVRWGSGWQPLDRVRDTIAVKGAAPVVVDLKFSRHGPIFYEDVDRRRAYALRSALHEPGTAPYLAGLRLSQTRNCREFLEAAKYWHAPSENLICGDIDGNIAWRASALAPVRNGWNGRLPVPGHGTFEWKGFRQDLPTEYNPPSGLIVTANHNVQPKGFSPPFMFKDADVRYERITRLRQLLTPGRRYSLDDHRRVQLDAHSLRAAADVALFRGWTASDPNVERARVLLAAWDAVYRRESIEAALYEVWRDVVDEAATLASAPAPPSRAAAQRELADTLRVAIDRLGAIQGPDWAQWRWGRLHARAFPHPLLRAFDLPAVERPGGGGTVAADGASFRAIFDTSNWDDSLATNTPGQSGQPASPYYGNLLPLWADDRYFPLAFSQTAVRAHAKHRLTLRPAPAR
jgi:penicillin G amidase